MLPHTTEPFPSRQPFSCMPVMSMFSLFLLCLSSSLFSCSHKRLHRAKCLKKQDRSFLFQCLVRLCAMLCAPFLFSSTSFALYYNFFSLASCMEAGSVLLFLGLGLCVCCNYEYQISSLYSFSFSVKSLCASLARLFLLHFFSLLCIPTDVQLARYATC